MIGLSVTRFFLAYRATLTIHPWQFCSYLLLQFSISTPRITSKFVITIPSFTTSPSFTLLVERLWILVAHLQCPESTLFPTFLIEILRNFEKSWQRASARLPSTRVQKALVIHRSPWLLYHHSKRLISLILTLKINQLLVELKMGDRTQRVINI